MIQIRFRNVRSCRQVRSRVSGIEIDFRDIAVTRNVDTGTGQIPQTQWRR